MERHFPDADLDLDIVDFGVQRFNFQSAQVTRKKARERSSSKEAKMTERLFEKGHLNVADFSVRRSPTGSGFTIMPAVSTPEPSTGATTGRGFTIMPAESTPEPSTGATTGRWFTIMPAESTPEPPTGATTCFSNLPEDVLFIIAEHCDPQDLPKFCLASKNVKNASIPHIYRYVDLSTHNRGLVTSHGYELPKLYTAPHAESETREEHSDSVRCTDIPVNMIRRQETFIKTLMNREEYRKYVRVVIWTFLPPTIHCRRFSTDVVKPAFWNLMLHLQNIRRFDLADISDFWSTVSPRPSRLPDRYFPNLSSLRLVGVMEPVIVAPIVSTIDPTKLVSLTLDNVQCCGKAPYGTSFTPAPRLPRGAMECKYSKWWTTNPKFIWPGLMRGVLKPLTGRCTGLKSLTLRKVGDRNSEEIDTLRAMNECALMHEWSSFIESVSGTLEEFKFEQGPRQAGQLSRIRVHPVRSMDRLFGLVIFPALLVGPWPCLKVMEIRGVRSWIGQGMRLRKVKIEDQYEGLPFAISLEDQLKAAVGRGVTVTVEGEGRKFDLVGRPGLCGTRLS